MNEDDNPMSKAPMRPPPQMLGNVQANGRAVQRPHRQRVARLSLSWPRAVGSKTPLQAMKDWHTLKPELFRKPPYLLTGCDM